MQLNIVRLGTSPLSRKNPRPHVPFLFVFGVSVLFTFAASPSYADFINLTVTTDTQALFEFNGLWTFKGTPNPGDAEGPTITPFDFSTSHWVAELSSTKAVANARDLTARLMHRKSHDPAEGIGPIIPVTLTGMSRPAAGVTGKAGAAQDMHAKHFDIFRFQAQLPAGDANGSIYGKAEHSAGPLATWSYHWLSDGTITVKVDNKVVQGPASGHAGDPDKSGALPKGATSYRVIFASQGARLPADPVTDTTLAFLGEIDGAPGQLDLGLAIHLFGGAEDVLAPMFLDSLGQRDLFVGIDLTQWLSFPTPFDPGDEFDFVAGRNDLFPGILIGTSPITYDPLTGFGTDNLATGRFEIVGIIDGGTVPEPSTLILLMSGVALLGAWRWKQAQGRFGVFRLSVNGVNRKWGQSRFLPLTF